MMEAVVAIMGMAIFASVFGFVVGYVVGRVA